MLRPAVPDSLSPQLEFMVQVVSDLYSDVGIFIFPFCRSLNHVILSIATSVDHTCRSVIFSMSKDFVSLNIECKQPS